GTRPSDFRPTSITATSFSIATTVPFRTLPSMLVSLLKVSSSRAAKLSLLAVSPVEAVAVCVIQVPSSLEVTLAGWLSPAVSPYYGRPRRVPAAGDRAGGGELGCCAGQRA